MTSENVPPWDFTPIYDLLDAFRPPLSPDNQFSQSSPVAPTPILDPTLFNPKSSEPSSLGDFTRLYEFLGRPIQDVRPRQESNGSSSSSRPDYSTPPSSITDDAVHVDDPVDTVKEVRWADEVDGAELTEQFESEAEPSHRRLHHTRRHRRNRSSLSSPVDGSRPSSIEEEAFFVRPKSERSLWVPPSAPKIHVDPMIIQPIEALTAEEKKERLIRKLKKGFGLKLESLGNKDQDGIHVFVDCSNIIIGFYNTLKIRRGYNIRAYTKQAPISWPSLALILERGRPVARRILVGSNGSPLHGQPAKLPDYMLEAEKCGYELNILDRVLKRKDPIPLKQKRRGSGNGNGYATTSGHSSGSDGASMSSRVVAEQGVDEILQMKLLESLVDTQRPSTIVLASGDAAQAEYSGGFFKNVERALAKGWKVELAAWSSCLSQDYRSKDFLQKWKGKFKIILLDDFSEELLAMYTQPIAFQRPAIL